VREALSRLPAGLLPTDRRYNPAAQHPYVVSKALGQVQNYSTPELVRAMDILLECNQRLVTSGLDEALVLQQALVQILGAPRPRAAAAR
jgi:DNA polymerase III delta subunit